MADTTSLNRQMEEGGGESEPVLSGVPQAETGPAPSLRQRAGPARLAGAAVAVMLLVEAAYRITRTTNRRWFAAPPLDADSLEELWGGTWSHGESEFKLTNDIYSNTNQEHACTSEFGDDYATADWKYDLKRLRVRNVSELCDALGINVTFNVANYFVTNQGRFFYSVPRAYFFERHGGNPPSNWLVHDVHGAITLGSWFGISGPVLCVKRDAVVTWERHPGMFLNLYAAGVWKVMPLEEAKSVCAELGADCAGVTCGHDASFGTGSPGMAHAERSCTVREGQSPLGLQPSPTGEVTYLKHSG